MRSDSFADSPWVPSGPSLTLRKSSVAGALSFFNPTTAVYDINGDEGSGGTTDDLSDITDAIGKERAKLQWNARDYRKGRHVLVLPRAAPLASRLQKRSGSHKVLLGIVRMFTLYPYWDVSWLIGLSFTIGCLIFVASGLFYWLPIAFPNTAFPRESSVAGGVSSFIGATLFQIGAVLLLLESYNDRAETQFGGAMEHLFVNRLGIARRVKSHRCQHFDIEKAPGQVPARNGSLHRLLSTRDGEVFVTAAAAGQEDSKANVLASRDWKDKTHAEREWQWWPSWDDVRTHYLYETGFLASFIMSIGATVFYVCGILALPGVFEKLGEGVLQGVYYFCYLLGGVLFVVSSVLYILETQPNWYTPQPRKIGWHVGAWNLVGGIGWTLAASFGYCKPDWCEYQSQLSLIWASAAFSFGSALQWYESLDKYIVVIGE